MYDENLLINKIFTDTGYDCELSNSLEIQIIDTTISFPKIEVGHIGLKRQKSSDIWTEGYIQLESSLIQLTQIKIYATRNSINTVLTNVRDAYKNYSPLPDADFSSLVFIDGDMRFVSSTQAIWVEVVGLVFPSII